MNRKQRRASARNDGARQVAEIERLRVTKERELEAQSREICDWIRASNEPLAERLQLVSAAIDDFESNPATLLVAGPALVNLRELRDELDARARMH